MVKISFCWYFMVVYFVLKQNLFHRNRESAKYQLLWGDMPNITPISYLSQDDLESQIPDCIAANPYSGL
jgi:hypothetical protein